MIVRKRIALAVATAALGSGLALAPAATAAPAPQEVGAAYSCGYYNGTALTKSGQTGSAAVKRIKEVQCLINRNTSYPTILGVDGKFGTKTYNAVKTVQKKARISVDGQVGKNTWAKLRAGVWW
ncbi:peptidoglycan-binding domain-containing protein [Streptomyces sp. G5(2025)]|uniref:peptidoglycan-binding domain-containing protein n=1 Tax=Streptomyces sp. G5(2025) TaxID=3406628 RepID=UPI003C2879F6